MIALPAPLEDAELPLKVRNSKSEAHSAAIKPLATPTIGNDSAPCSRRSSKAPSDGAEESYGATLQEFISAVKCIFKTDDVQASFLFKSRAFRCSSPRKQVSQAQALQRRATTACRISKVHIQKPEKPADTPTKHPTCCRSPRFFPRLNTTRTYSSLIVLGPTLVRRNDKTTVRARQRQDDRPTVPAVHPVQIAVWPDWPSSSVSRKAN